MTGDNTVYIDMSYFGNPYHNGLCIRVDTVRAHDDKYFSTGSDVISLSMMDSYSTFTHDGVSRDGSNKVYHMIKDRELIDSIIAGGIKAFDAARKVEDTDRLEHLKAEILNMEAEVEEIERGDGLYRIGFKTFRTQEYRAKVIDQIDKILNV